MSKDVRSGSRCHQQLILRSQPREPSTARAVSVPLTRTCTELAALDAICRGLSVWNYVRERFRIPLSPPDSKALTSLQITSNHEGRGSAKRTILACASAISFVTTSP